MPDFEHTTVCHCIIAIAFSVVSLFIQQVFYELSNEFKSLCKSVCSGSRIWYFYLKNSFSCCYCFVFVIGEVPVVQVILILGTKKLLESMYVFVDLLYRWMQYYFLMTKCQCVLFIKSIAQIPPSLIIIILIT